jgi:hypothetical protein
MSHSSGTVTFKDGLVLHFEYNGTTDICIPKLYETFEEMWEIGEHIQKLNVIVAMMKKLLFMHLMVVESNGKVELVENVCV